MGCSSSRRVADWSPGRDLTLGDLRGIAEIGVTPDEPRFREPLERDPRRWRLCFRETTGSSCSEHRDGEVCRRHRESLGGRLRFPADFVGRGDMSRGGLMLRCVLKKQELDYVPTAGATRHGTRPPRLEPLR